MHLLDRRSARLRPLHAVYARYFPQEHPARTTVVSKLVLDAKLEVEAIAYKPAT